MGWLKRVKIVFSAVANTTFDVTASVLTTAGNIACAVGGVGFAAAQIMERQFESAYYGRGTASAGLDVSGTLVHHDFSYNYSFPVHAHGDANGTSTHSLSNYVDPNMVRYVSMVCGAAGVLLNGLGHTIKTKQQYRYDVRHQQVSLKTTLAEPSMRDYLLVNSRSFCKSVSVVLLSYSLVSCVDEYSNLFRSRVHLTYPANSELQAKGMYYDGPLTFDTFLIDLKLDSQVISFNEPIIGNITILLDLYLKGKANVTYGGGLSFKEDGPATVSPEVTHTLAAIGGASAYLAGNFFARKERCKRREQDASSIVEDGLVPYRAFSDRV